ncbi:MAG: HAD-IIB family hydrolase [Microbacteriaceae bacterium]|nr:HAD-IIB family hydrolase [Microbacteriaceae bacterium]
MTQLPKLIAFDLDDTLAPSKSRVPDEILELLARLLAHTNVAVISGGNIGQFQAQLLAPLVEQEIDEASLERLHLLPTCGTHYELRQNGAWHTLYREVLSETDRAAALQALEKRARELGLWEHETWGEILEDRGSQVTFSALGQNAPVQAKAAWDPSGEKKNKLAAAVQQDLPHLAVRSGGSTSVDITRQGIDKAYGMQKLATQTGIDLSEMLFVGDRLDPAGNDYPVLRLGVTCHAVHSWQDTATFLHELLSVAA